MDDIIKELEELDKNIKKADKELNTKQGVMIEKMETLKSEFYVDTLEAAKKLKLEKEDKLLKLETEIQSDFKQLKKDYEF